MNPDSEEISREFDLPSNCDLYRLDVDLFYLKKKKNVIFLLQCHVETSEPVTGSVRL